MQHSVNIKVKHKIILVFVVFICLFGTLYSADFAFADRNLELDYPTAPSDPLGEPVVTPTTTKTTLPEYIKYLFNFLIGIGGILAFAIFLYGGAMWLFSAGNPGIIGPAKKKMINGIMGLALLLCSYVIIYTINPDLTVLRLGMIWESNIGPEITPSELDPKMYQEIPIGLLVEDIVAKNISCFDKEKNLINCRTKEIIAGPIKDIFDRESHYNYCYEYDDKGDKKGLNDYHDRMDCIKELLKAIEIKSAELRETSEELEDIINSKCKCINCNGPGYCDCDGNNNCFCCGSPREEPPPSCSGNPPTPTLRNDPCTLDGRKKIDGLRNQIYQIINGTDKKIEGKDIIDNPNHDTKNLSLVEAQIRFKGLKQELNDDLDDLLEAEELVKFPSFVKRMNLAQYLEKKILNNLKKQEFKNFSAPGYDSVSTYCKIFNCSDEEEEIVLPPPVEELIMVSAFLTLDRSISMLGEPLLHSKAGALLFLNLLEEHSLKTTEKDEVGVVDFGFFAKLTCGMTSDFQKAKNAVSSIKIKEPGTNMGTALKLSIEEIVTNATDDKEWSIIYFTDGWTNAGLSKGKILSDIVPEAISANITIFTIGYGGDVDDDFLAQIAEVTGGEYYATPSLTELEEAYKKIFGTITYEIPEPPEPSPPYDYGDICPGYGLNTEGILCNLFLLDGAPSTFYHNIKEYERYK